MKRSTFRTRQITFFWDVILSLSKSFIKSHYMPWWSHPPTSADNWNRQSPNLYTSGHFWSQGPFSTFCVGAWEWGEEQRWRWEWGVKRSPNTKVVSKEVRTTRQSDEIFPLVLLGHENKLCYHFNQSRPVPIPPWHKWYPGTYRKINDRQFSKLVTSRRYIIVSYLR